MRYTNKKNGGERKERWEFSCGSLSAQQQVDNDYVSLCEAVVPWGGPLLWLQLSLGFHTCPSSLPTVWRLKYLFLTSRFIQMEYRT